MDTFIIVHKYKMNRNALITSLLPLLALFYLCAPVSCSDAQPPPPHSSATPEYATGVKHVLISVPGNLTIYYSSSTYLVVAWDIPNIYDVHDPSIQKFETLKQGNAVKVSKVTHPLVAKKVPKVSNGTDLANSTAADASTSSDGTSATTTKSTPTESPLSEMEQTTEMNSNTDNSEEHVWVCKPAFKFANYTIKINNYPHTDQNKWATTLKESSATSVSNWTVMYPWNKEIVDYDTGCIKHFEIQWKMNGTHDAPKVRIVGPHVRTSNLTDLKPSTTYNINVSAVYVSGHKMTAKPIDIMTRKKGENSCKCDWHGTKNMEDKCVVQDSGSFCKCRKEYTGPFCEKCKEGYYRTSEFTPCHKCPCEVSISARKNTCTFEQGYLKCNECEVGYSGNICHRCDKDFYRYGSHCILCQCHGNTSPNAQSCHPMSGACLNCQKNTTGFYCDKCRPGYHGDAITHKNCTRVGESNKQSGGVIIIVGIVVVIIIAIPIVVIAYRIFRARQKRHAFWTVEMRREQDDVDFKNDDDNVLEEVDDMDFYEKQGGGSPSKYARLHESV